MTDTTGETYEDIKRRHTTGNAGPPNGSDDGEQAPPIEPLYIINPAKWQGLLAPERRWIVPHWIPFGAAAGLYGPPGHGKTLLV